MSDSAHTVSSIGVFGIGSVAEDQVDVVHLQPFERAVDRLHEVLPVERLARMLGASWSPMKNFVDTT